MAVNIIDSASALIAFLDRLEDLPSQPPSLYLDLEGINLSRHGSISIIQVFVLPPRQTYLLDIHFLQKDAFSTCGSSGATFKSILQDATVPKVFFDVRNDAGALFAHFQISVKGACDLQLMELATRSYRKDRVAGLARCIKRDSQLSANKKKLWEATKQQGIKLFRPESGGSYANFNIRPMRQEIVDYCANDVIHLPALWAIYNRKLSKLWQCG